MEKNKEKRVYYPIDEIVRLQGSVYEATQCFDDACFCLRELLRGGKDNYVNLMEKCSITLDRIDDWLKRNREITHEEYIAGLRKEKIEKGK